MAICDKGWTCPCLDSFASLEMLKWECNLAVFEPHGNLTYDEDLRPDECPYADILKAMVAGHKVRHERLPEEWGYRSHAVDVYTIAIEEA